MADGDTLSGSEIVTISVEATSGSSAIDRVMVLVDDVALTDGPDFVASFEFEWACSLSSMGEHLVSARATSFEGATGAETISVHIGYCDEYEVRGILILNIQNMILN